MVPPSHRDPSQLFYQQDSIRRLIILAYWAVIILATPLWWYLTSIERLSLPSARIQQQSQHSLQLPIRICVEATDSTLSNDIQHLLPRRLLKSQDLQFQVFAQSQCEQSKDAYVVKKGDSHFIVNHRELLCPQESSSRDVVDTLVSLFKPPPDSRHRVAQYSPHFRLAFSLLNEDGSAGSPITKWNIQSALRSHINPLLSRLEVLHNFTIESQVQVHAPLAFSPLPIEQDFGIAPENLTFFVNSAEWTLSSGSSNDPVLHFILFVPSINHRPLRILNNDGSISQSNSFLLPQWGGIFIHNPPQTTESNHLATQDLDFIFSTFSDSLQTLLGVPKLPDHVHFSPSNEGSLLSEWQIDALLRRRIFENARGSKETLLSIVKLVDQIDNMPVGEDVKGDIETSLNSLSKAYDLSQTSLRDTFKYSAEASTLSSRAFFNPGMLALLYFPAEHKYAIYTPLFASAVIPLFVAALRELKAWKQERKLAKSKTN